MNKKGQGQLVAYVLLIGFTIVLGIMVGNWMVKQAGKAGEKTVSMYERDASCPEVTISAICDGGPRIKNIKGYTISKIKVNGIDRLGEIEIGQVSQILNIGDTVIPFIRIGGNEFPCFTREIKIPEDICA